MLAGLVVPECNRPLGMQAELVVLNGFRPRAVPGGSRPSGIQASYGLGNELQKGQGRALYMFVCLFVYRYSLHYLDTILFNV